MNTKPILLWKHQQLTNAFTLRVGELRYIGLIRTDKNGENYWKFREFTDKTLNNSDNSKDSPSSPISPVQELKDYEHSINQSELPSNPK